MEFFEFAILSCVNLALIAFIIRRWSVLSAEGLCMGYLGMAALTDNVQLVYEYLRNPGSLPLRYGEFGFRVYPTAVHILGLLVLMAGLTAARARPRPVARELGGQQMNRLRGMGYAIAFVGAALTAVALYLVGALQPANFYSALSAFRSQALPFGGFWYRGADIIVFGLALTLPGLRGRTGKFLCVLSLMMFVSFFLRTNKGGLEEPILWAAIVLAIYDRAFFRSLLRPRIIVLACAIAFAGVGAKMWFLPWAMHREPAAPMTVENLLKVATATAATRWGDDGLYRGYCQFVNTWPENRNLFSGNKVAVYALTSWVPRLIYPTKPDHPFRGLGFMIYSDFHAYPEETPAPTLVGSAYADDGLLSMIGYLFLAGWSLGMFRRFAAGPKGSLYLHCGYVLFVLFGGLSADEGILGSIYTLILAYGVIGGCFLLQFAWRSVKLRAPSRIQEGQFERRTGMSGAPDAQFP